MLISNTEKSLFVRFLLLTSLLSLTIVVVFLIPKREASTIFLDELTECSLPCWHRLEPSKSTLLDFQVTLENLQRLNVVRHVEIASENEVYYVYERMPLQSSTQVFLRDAVLVELGRRYYQIVTVEDFLEVLGNPELIGQPLYEANKWPNHPYGSPLEQLSCEDVTEANVVAAYPYPRTLMMMFPSKGITLWIDRAESFANALCPNFRVISAEYYRPTTMAKLLNISRTSPEGSRLDDFHQYNWVGYGSYYGFDFLSEDAN